MEIARQEAQQYLLMARYYSPETAFRFLSVDPVTMRRERIRFPQRLNLYSYAANNPIKFVDPTGEDIAVSSEGNNSAVRNYLVNTIMRPSGRAALEKIANDSSFTATFKDTHLESVADVKRIAAGAGGALEQGLTAPIVGTDSDGNESVVGVEVSLDTFSISQAGPDGSGVTTVGEELYHSEDFRQQKTQAEVDEGHKPTPMTGPARQAGESMSSEEPDISRKEAKERLSQWLDKDKK